MTDAVPSFPPLQETFVDPLMKVLSGSGSVTATVAGGGGGGGMVREGGDMWGRGMGSGDGGGGGEEMRMGKGDSVIAERKSGGVCPRAAGGSPCVGERACAAAWNGCGGTFIPAVA